MSRAFRFAGSVFFTLSGSAYTFLPPRTSTMFFESEWPAKSWGILFIVGGLISLYGVISKYTHHERLGVSFVVIATLALALNNGLIMFDHPVVWTRLGGGLFYLGCCMWALERWYRLGREVDVIREITGVENEEE